MRVRPFRTWRPTPERAARVAAVPYDVVTREEARALVRGNPESFLHVSRADADLDDAVDEHAPAVHERARATWTSWKTSGAFALDETPRLFVYRLRYGALEQVGVMGLASVDAYREGVIKVHERTRRDKEDDRVLHLRAVEAHDEPTLLTYRRLASVDAAVAEAMASAPMFDFVAPDGVAHTVWPMSEAASASLAAAFDSAPALYVADGHHRSAAAARVRDDGVGGKTDAFLALLIPSDVLRVHGYHRRVRDLGGQTPESLRAALSAVGALSPANGPFLPTTAGEVGVGLSDGWWRLRFAAGAGAGAGAGAVDAQRLQDVVLAPLLGIGDPRSDARLSFAGGLESAHPLQQALEQGRAACVFALAPLPVDTLMAVADAGGVLPPKSTWFAPKPRSGLLVHPF